MDINSGHEVRFGPSVMISSPIDSFCYDLDDQLRQFVYHTSMEAIDAADKIRAEIDTPEKAEKRRSSIRDLFLSCIGGLPQGGPLEAEITGTIQCSGFRIEKIIYQSRPKEYVTGHLYIPDNLEKPSAAVLFLCGHFSDSMHNPEYQAACQRMVKTGLIVFAIDTISEGERHSFVDKETGKTTILREGSYAHDYLGMQCLFTGRSLASYFVHDAIRAVDYLASRPEVDVSRIGVTGNSGGGTQTAMMMMADPRVAAAIPATFITSRKRYMPLGEGQCMEQIWPGFTAAGLDYADILIAMAPRPVMVFATRNDFFPIEGTRESVAQAKEIYRIFNKEENLSLSEFDCPHQYSEEMADKAAAFFNTHLNGRIGIEAVAKSEIRILEPESLSCTHSGQVMKEYPDCRTVHDDSADMLKSLSEKRKREKDGGRAWLREQVFRNRKDCPVQTRCVVTEEREGLLIRHLLWWSQTGVFNYGVLFEKIGNTKETLPLVLALWDGGTMEMDYHADWICKTCDEGKRVFVIDTSGSGTLQPRQDAKAYCRGNETGFGYHIGFRIGLCLLWMGDSIPALRTYDVIRAIDAVNDLNGVRCGTISVYGWGKYGLYGKLASLVEDGIADCVWENAFRYEDWVRPKHYPFEGSIEIMMPDVLEHLDFIIN